MAVRQSSCVNQLAISDLLLCVTGYQVAWFQKFQNQNCGSGGGGFLGMEESSKGYVHVAPELESGLSLSFFFVQNLSRRQVDGIMT